MKGDEADTFQTPEGQTPGARRTLESPEEDSSDETDTEKNVARNGCGLIIHKLMKYFAPNDVNLVMTVLNDLSNFSRRRGETLEEAFARWDTISERARRNSISIGDPRTITCGWFSQNAYS